MGPFQLEYVHGAWHVKLPDQEGSGARIDQAVVDASFVSRHFVEGRIRAVHGLDFDLASRLQLQELVALGVRAVPTLGGRAPPSRNARRVRLMEDGTIEDLPVGAL